MGQVVTKYRQLKFHINPLQSYVDENHNIAGVAQHLYHSLGRFFGDCLQYDRDLLETSKMLPSI